ncbi:putative protodioscin 26-O-beta-D-glucosidase [Dioscorea sansibarensis]
MKEAEDQAFGTLSPNSTLKKLKTGGNGNIAVGSYHRYKEDVKLLKDMNLDSYRFSVSWSRITPRMHHALCYIVPLGCISILGCSVGDSIIEPYIVTHNLIFAHGAGARLYTDKYQRTQGGQIGTTLVCMWYHPYDQTHKHVEAASRALDFMLALLVCVCVYIYKLTTLCLIIDDILLRYLDPSMHGDYPFNMKAMVRDRLPTFSKEEVEMITGSYDFIGINYYTARYARKVPYSHDPPSFLHINESYAGQLGKFSFKN